MAKITATLAIQRAVNAIESECYCRNGKVCSYTQDANLLLQLDNKLASLQDRINQLPSVWEDILWCKGYRFNREGEWVVSREQVLQLLKDTLSLEDEESSKGSGYVGKE